ncbi:MAG: OsmC family protein [Chloroflexi bacterium]|nr:OsmC family protein [Chloroflexota bacterium]
MTIRSRQFVYRTFLSWEGERKGRLSAQGKPSIQVATPPEFQGHEGIWCPEDLFVASLESCIMTTFIYQASRSNIPFVSYESSAEGAVELVEGRFAFSQMTVKPKVVLVNQGDIERAKELFHQVERSCFVSNSIKPKVSLEPQIEARAS